MTSNLRLFYSPEYRVCLQKVQTFCSKNSSELIYGVLYYQTRKTNENRSQTQPLRWIRAFKSSHFSFPWLCSCTDPCKTPHSSIKAKTQDAGGHPPSIKRSPGEKKILHWEVNVGVPFWSRPVHFCNCIIWVKYVIQRRKNVLLKGFLPRSSPITVFKPVWLAFLCGTKDNLKNSQWSVVLDPNGIHCMDKIMKCEIFLKYLKCSF